MYIPRDLKKFKKDFSFFGAEDYGFIHYKQSDKKVLDNQAVIMEYNTLIFVIKGTKIIHTGYKKYQISQEESIFIPKGKYILSEIIDFKDREYQSLIFFFSDSALRLFVKKYHTLIQKNHQSTYSEIFKTQNDFFLNQIFMGFLTLYHLPNQHFFISLKYEEIFLYLLQDQKNSRNFSNFLCQFIEHDDTLLQNIFNLENRDYYNVADMADYAKMDQSSFSKKFKETLGITPKEWLDNQRFEKACIMLEFSDKNITQISQELGFNSPAWFIKRFKDRFGITPKQFQKTKNLYFFS